MDKPRDFPIERVSYCCSARRKSRNHADHTQLANASANAHEESFTRAKITRQCSSRTNFHKTGSSCNAPKSIANNRDDSFTANDEQACPRPPPVGVQRHVASALIISKQTVQVATPEATGSLFKKEITADGGGNQPDCEETFGRYCSPDKKEGIYLWLKNIPFTDLEDAATAEVITAVLYKD